MTSSFAEFLGEVRRMTEAALEGIALEPPPDIWAARDSMEIEHQEDPEAQYLLRHHLYLALVELGEAGPDAKPAIAREILRCLQGQRMADQVVFMQKCFADSFPTDVASDLGRLAGG